MHQKIAVKRRLSLPKINGIIMLKGVTQRYSILALALWRLTPLSENSLAPLAKGEPTHYAENYMTLSSP